MGRHRQKSLNHGWTRMNKDFFRKRKAESEKAKTDALRGASFPLWRFPPSAVPIRVHSYQHREKLSQATANYSAALRFSVAAGPRCVHPWLRSFVFIRGFNCFEMENARIKILVDDEKGLCAGLQEGLQREGYFVDAAKA